jgi:putative flippase GtrA
MKRGQHKRHSLIEALVNTGVGFVLSIAAVQWLFPLFGVRMTLGENLIATLLMTVISVLRGYVLRRAFNHWHLRSHS